MAPDVKVSEEDLKYTDILRMLRRLSQKDCGDSSCQFAGKGKGGMRTNGGCRCVDALALELTDAIANARAEGFKEGRVDGIRETGALWTRRFASNDDYKAGFMAGMERAAEIAEGQSKKGGDILAHRQTLADAIRNEIKDGGE